MKLGRFAILMIGIMIFVIASAWGYFLYYMPNMKEVTMLNDNKTLQDAEAAKMPQAKKRVETAKKMVDAKANEWMKIASTRTPPVGVEHGGIDLSVDPWHLSVDTPKFRNNIQRAVNEQVKKGGVKVLNAPLVQIIDPNLPVNQILSTFYNYPALKFPVLIFDFGTITVQGNYKQILDNVRAYKNMPHYLAVTDGLRIDGTSPNLTGTYNLTVVGYIRTKKNGIAPAVPEGAGGAAAGGMGAFGGMGGPPAGMGRGMGGPAGGGLGGPGGPPPGLGRPGGPGALK
jgi:hypothetical protein